MTIVTITGNLTADPVFKRLGKDAVPLTEMRIAASRRRRTTDAAGAEQWVDVDQLYIDVDCWGDLAVNCKASLKRGFPITVTGRLVTESWVDSKTNESRSKIILKATQVAFDLANFQVNSQKTTNVGHNANGDESVKVKTADDLLPIPPRTTAVEAPVSSSGFGDYGEAPADGSADGSEVSFDDSAEREVAPAF